jgi:hypothetical protein
MVAHTYSKEAQKRAMDRYIAKNRDRRALVSKCRYKYDTNYRETKKNRMREHSYAKNAILFVKYLYR